MTKVTEETLAKSIIGFFKSSGMSIELIMAEIEAAKNIILDEKTVTLNYLNSRLREIDIGFVAINEEIFAEFLDFMNLRYGSNIQFGTLH